MGTLLEVKDLKLHYKVGKDTVIYAVGGVSLALEEGEVLGIAGESGCGKSTLALGLMGYYEHPLYYGSGMLKLEDEDLVGCDRQHLRKNILGQKIAYIPQAAMNVLNPTLKIKIFILDLLKEHRPELSAKEMLDLAYSRFEKLGLEKRALEAYPNELSGGMKQRIVIAISTILNPDVLIADEPTSALDVTSQKKVIWLLKQLMEEGYVKSMIFITHELPLLYHLCDHIKVMYAGVVVESGSAEEVIKRPLHPYAKALMASIVVPEKGMKEKVLTRLEGAPPHLREPLVGCRFYERCHERCEACKTGSIPLQLQGSRSYLCLRKGGEKEDE